MTQTSHGRSERDLGARRATRQDRPRPGRRQVLRCPLPSAFTRRARAGDHHPGPREPVPDEGEPRACRCGGKAGPGGERADVGCDVALPLEDRDEDDYATIARALRAAAVPARRRRRARAVPPRTAPRRGPRARRGRAVMSRASGACEGGRAGRNRHGCLHPTLALVLLAPLIGVKVTKERRQRPPYAQVAAEIRRAIADGEAKPGERLPPATRPRRPSSASTRTPCWRSLRLLQ